MVSAGATSNLWTRCTPGMAVRFTPWPCVCCETPARPRKSLKTPSSTSGGGEQLPLRPRQRHRLAVQHSAPQGDRRVAQTQQGARQSPVRSGSRQQALGVALRRPQRVRRAPIRGSCITEALTTLRPEQREVVVLAYFSGLTHSEISQRLGTPLGTVKTRMRLAMKKLREALAPRILERPSTP